MNSLAVIVTTPPHSPLTITAINYIEEALIAGFNVIGVFFYQDGVIHASSQVSIASDEFQAICKFQNIAETYQVPLHICITAAEKRGIECDVSQGSKINTAFTVAGLGELVDLSTKATRLVQF